MIKRMILMIVIVVIVLGGIGGYKAYSGYQMYKAFLAMGTPAQTVSSITASSSEWQSKVNVVGSLRAAKGVEIANELAGIVEDIKFHSGGDVKSGTLLVTLRAEDDIAKLHSLQATAKFAAITYTRDKKQLKAQAVSQATVDNDKANLDNANALVAEQKALVDKKIIHAPFSGHMGIRNVDVGQYLAAGTSIVTLQELDPIYLDFYLPQQSLAQIKQGQKVSVKNDTYPDKIFSGTITAISSKVDPSTRNVQVRAALKNPDHSLLPGMYSTASINVGQPTSYVTLPQTAITYNPYGDTVFIINEEKDKKEEKPKDEKAKKDDKAKDEKPKEEKPAGEKAKDASGKPQLYAHQTFVTVGDTRGDQVAILKGIKEGDVVVTSGQIKLQNGSPVIIDNTAPPKNDENPKPQDY